MRRVVVAMIVSLTLAVAAPVAAETAPLVPWPGSSEVPVVDEQGTFGEDLSGLDYEPTGTDEPGVLWGVDNGLSLLYRLVWTGEAWVPDGQDDWSDGKVLQYSDRTGSPDAEGVTVTGDGHIAVGAERDNHDPDVSRNSVLKYDPSTAGTTLVATEEWDLTADLPDVGPNLGIEAVQWVADAPLTDAGFVDEATGQLYDPTNYPDHDGGVYFVGVEGLGMVYAYVLLNGGAYERVAEIDPGLPMVMGLDYDDDTTTLWAVCDDNCWGRSARLAINGGTFGVVEHVERPADMRNLNNEGFATTPVQRCSGGVRPVYWADDDSTDGHSIRARTLPCPDDDPEEPDAPEAPSGLDEPVSHPFSDVSDGSVHSEAIAELSARGIVQGTSSTTFGPALSITRGQLASMIARTGGLEPVEAVFMDVSAGDVHAGAIGALADAGIVQGFEDGSFRPHEPITRAQAVALIGRQLDVSGHGEDRFTDISTSGHRGLINGLADLGIARGSTDGQFRPRDDLRRDQAASFLVRALRDVDSAASRS